jgi:hypothetical protein
MAAGRERWDATHNPFSGFREDRHLLDTDREGDRAAVDLTLNGRGAAGPFASAIALKERILAMMRHSPEQQRERFWFDALAARPHGRRGHGHRPADDVARDENIRDVIAFPKASLGRTADERAEPVDDAQLRELGFASSAGRVCSKQKGPGCRAGPVRCGSRQMTGVRAGAIRDGRSAHGGGADEPDAGGDVAGNGVPVSTMSGAGEHGTEPAEALAEGAYLKAAIAVTTSTRPPQPRRPAFCESEYVVTGRPRRIRRWCRRPWRGR